MSVMIRQILFRLVLPVLVPVAVGLGSAVLTAHVMLEKMDVRISHLEDKVIGEKLVERTGKMESQIDRHEKTLERDFARHEHTVNALGVKTEDQEKRLTRLETLVSETQALLTEIRTDVKILLRGGQQ